MSDNRSVSWSTILSELNQEFELAIASILGRCRAGLFTDGKVQMCLSLLFLFYGSPDREHSVATRLYLKIAEPSAEQLQVVVGSRSHYLSNFAHNGLVDLDDLSKQGSDPALSHHRALLDSLQTITLAMQHS